MAKSRNAAINRLLSVARKKANLPTYAKARVVFEAAASAMRVRVPVTKQRGYDLLDAWVGVEVAAKAKTPRRVKPWTGPNGITSPPEVAAPPHVASGAFLRSFEWRQLRMIVLKKRGARCECCGSTPKDGTTQINVDHIKPRKTHPQLALTESNLQILCGACNHGKGNWDDTDWRGVSETVN